MNKQTKDLIDWGQRKIAASLTNDIKKKIPEYLFELNPIGSKLLNMIVTNCDFYGLNKNQAAMFSIKSINGENVEILMNGLAIVPKHEYHRLKKLDR